LLLGVDDDETYLDAAQDRRQARRSRIRSHQQRRRPHAAHRVLELHRVGTDGQREQHHLSWMKAGADQPGGSVLHPVRNLRPGATPRTAVCMTCERHPFAMFLGEHP
jgi:hypothetical protein